MRKQRTHSLNNTKAKHDKHCNTTRFKANRNKTRPRNTNKHKQRARWCQTAFSGRIRNIFDVCFGVSIHGRAFGVGGCWGGVRGRGCGGRDNTAAQLWLPDVYGGIHVCTVFRWKLDSTVSNGRSHTVSEADYHSRQNNYRNAWCRFNRFSN